MYDGAFSPTFHAGGELALGIAWLLGLGAAVVIVLCRAVGTASMSPDAARHRRHAAIGPRSV
jgi:hypothetical protein